jgi:hypothetical protein
MRRTVEWCTEIKRGGSASTAEISGRNGRLEETRQREGGTHRRVRAGRI